MDQKKIGKFILELRKEKNMTQSELANKLQISDKTVSKWENGRGMPDLSLIKPLCDILGITVNDLLSGEKIENENYQEKAEENILNTIKYSNNEIKKNNKAFKTIIIIIILTIALLVTMFFVDIKRMRQNKPVIFGTWGFKYSPEIQLQEAEIYSTIRDSLVEINDNEQAHYENEKSFVSMKIYLIEDSNTNQTNVYAWVLQEKYYYENGEIIQDSSSSAPYKFVVEKINDKYHLSSSETPRDISYYYDDMKKLFPKYLIKEMENVYYDGTNEMLIKEIENQVKLYFHE